MFLLSQLLHAAFKPVELGRQPSVSIPLTLCKKTCSNSGLKCLDLGTVDFCLMYLSGKMFTKSVRKEQRPSNCHIQRIVLYLFIPVNQDASAQTSDRGKL